MKGVPLTTLLQILRSSSLVLLESGCEGAHQARTCLWALCCGSEQPCRAHQDGAAAAPLVSEVLAKPMSMLPRTLLVSEQGWTAVSVMTWQGKQVRCMCCEPA